MSKPDVGTQVRVRRGPWDDSPWVNATVREHLSTQFVAEVEEGAKHAPQYGIVFGLYNAERESWKRGW